MPRYDSPARPFPILLLLSLLLADASGATARGQETATVHAVLFYSPTCPHCHKVMTEDLPPLIQKYGERLDIAAIDVTTAGGQSLYRATVDHFDLQPPRVGVPTLVVGLDVLVGDVEIPARLPGLVERGLSEGGVDWPAVPAIRQALLRQRATLPAEPARPGPVEAFGRDPVGNAMAVMVLLGLLASAFISVRAVVRGRRASRPLPTWIIPVLAAVGMGAASYLAFVEVTGQEAVCGPIGNCNAVQQSPYAFLFGILPVGVLGQVGYLAMFAVWMAADLGPRRLAPFFWRVLWGLALVGTLFSTYLTLLEPFVIGASCAWCLTSAIVMALMLLAVTGPTTATRLGGALS